MNDGQPAGSRGHDRKLTISVDSQGGRLDAWLSSRQEDLSRARIQSMIRAGHIRVNADSCKPNTQLKKGDVIDVLLPAPRSTEVTPEAIPLHVLYEDDHLLVVDKPAGMVVHPAAGHSGGTLVNALLHHCGELPGIGGEQRPGIVHRLDKDTSGLMVVAKSERAMNSLARQFREGRVGKVYLALTCGVPIPASGRVETLIGRHPRDRKRMSVEVEAGRQAVSHYQVVQILNEAALVAVCIETGRTHQIRVHLSHLGYPIMADPQYGGRPVRRIRPAGARRQMLHATVLAFCHPLRNRPLQFEAELPPDMRGVLRELGGTTPDLSKLPFIDFCQWRTGATPPEA